MKLEWMAKEGKDVPLPTLEVNDFMGKSFTTGPDGKRYQLPDQQFTNLYWFRYDWFTREDFKKQFKEIYGYELGIPVNWSAYEDIVQFLKRCRGNHAPAARIPKSTGPGPYLYGRGKGMDCLAVSKNPWMSGSQNPSDTDDRIQGPLQIELSF